MQKAYGCCTGVCFRICFSLRYTCIRNHWVRLWEEKKRFYLWIESQSWWITGEFSRVMRPTLQSTIGFSNWFWFILSKGNRVFLIRKDKLTRSNEFLVGASILIVQLDSARTSMWIILMFGNNGNIYMGRIMKTMRLEIE